MEEHDGVAALAADPVTRPSSTSTNGSLPQLPGISSLASVDTAEESPQMREANFATATAPQQEPPQEQEQQQQASFEQSAQQQMQPDQQQLQQSQEQYQPQGHHLEPPTTQSEPQVMPQLSQPATAAPAPTPGISTGGQAQTTPTCQNCQTGTTPLWRRDEFGAVLCNACGLFLKLHGRPRPISLKTDVIKSRNRVKTMRPDLATKKKQQQQAQQAQQQHQQAQAAASNFPGADPNGFDLNATPTGHRLHAQKSANGHGDGTNSPGSRGDTPLYNPAMPVFHGADDPNFQSSALSGFLSGASPNRPASPLNGDRKPDAPQTHEQLIAANSALKTRVSELEVIIELFRGRLGQLEGDEANARRAQEISSHAELEMRTQLEDSHRRENNLKRRLDEMEVELMAAKEAAGGVDSERAAKRARLSEPVEDAPVPHAVPHAPQEAPVEEAPPAEELPEQPVEAAPAEQPAAA